MKITKPKFWEKKNNIISYLLLPFSFVLQLLIIIKNKITYRHSFKIPIICVGNIYLGGTGKTPLSILIAQELLKNNKKPAIIKKYYREHFDEHNLIRASIENLFLEKHRYIAMRKAEEKQFDIAILDDGFQDFSIKTNLNILCFNGNQLIGNGFTLPSGPLRERINSIKRANVIVIIGDKNEEFEKIVFNVKKKVKIYYSKYSPTNINEFKDKKLFAFAGIGNPKNFFQLLTENKLDVQKEISYPDHYSFSKVEIEKLVQNSRKNEFQLITTEKDYFRIKNYGFNEIKYIKNDLIINNKKEFINQILDLL
tara:strand:- start:2562 stop:3491 length:930 start_codon:yes stop_codon:yes gene_type:complete